MLQGGKKFLGGEGGLLSKSVLDKRLLRPSPRAWHRLSCSGLGRGLGALADAEAGRHGYPRPVSERFGLAEKDQAVSMMDIQRALDSFKTGFTLAHGDVLICSSSYYP